MIINSSPIPDNEVCDCRCEGCRDCSDWCVACESHVERIADGRGVNDRGLCPACLEKECHEYDCEDCRVTRHSQGIPMACICGSFKIDMGLSFENYLVAQKQLAEMVRLYNLTT